MSNSKIDETILSVLPAGGHSKKVAMVIAAVAKALASDLPEGDESYQLIARRIEGLVRAGQLVALGNIKNWRFSEVPLAGSSGFW